MVLLRRTAVQRKRWTSVGSTQTGGSSDAGEGARAGNSPNLAVIPDLRPRKQDSTAQSTHGYGIHWFAHAALPPGL